MTKNVMWRKKTLIHFGLITEINRWFHDFVVNSFNIYRGCSESTKNTPKNCLLHFVQFCTGHQLQTRKQIMINFLSSFGYCGSIFYDNQCKQVYTLLMAQQLNMIMSFTADYMMPEMCKAGRLLKFN